MRTRAGLALGNSIRAAYELGGMTQATLAGEVNVSRSMVSLWVNGHKVPSIAHTKEIARVLGVSERRLLKLRREANLSREPKPTGRRRAGAPVRAVFVSSTIGAGS